MRCHNPTLGYSTSKWKDLHWLADSTSDFFVDCRLTAVDSAESTLRTLSTRLSGGEAGVSSLDFARMCETGPIEKSSGQSNEGKTWNTAVRCHEIGNSWWLKLSMRLFQQHAYSRKLLPLFMLTSVSSVHRGGDARIISLDFAWLCQTGSIENTSSHSNVAKTWINVVIK